MKMLALAIVKSQLSSTRFLRLINATLRIRSKLSPCIGIQRSHGQGQTNRGPREDLDRKGISSIQSNTNCHQGQVRELSVE